MTSRSEGQGREKGREGGLWGGGGDKINSNVYNGIPKSPTRPPPPPLLTHPQGFTPHPSSHPNAAKTVETKSSTFPRH